MLLGICGPSGSHESSLTRYLKSAYGFRRIRSGKPIKKAARQAFGLSKPLVAGKAKDMPTDRLGGATPRASMEAMSLAAEAAVPKAILGQDKASNWAAVPDAVV
jgi:hypothetical protein